MIGKRAWRRLASERGSVAVEAVLMLPVLIVFYVTSFSFFDAYRTQTVVTKSGYVVGDLLSRRTGIVRSADIAGMRDMMAFLTYAADGTEIRVTELRGASRRQGAGNHRVERRDRGAGADDRVGFGCGGGEDPAPHVGGARHDRRDADGLSAALPDRPARLHDEGFRGDAP